MKKCAVINDLSGFGKCSLTAELPIISVMGSEVHPLPTAVLSNQTAYDSFFELDLTDCMQQYADEWKKNNAAFDAILTGFVTCERQLDFIDDFIGAFRGKNTLLIVDPVMADNGALYNGYTEQMCNKIRSLCYRADIITPNIAELAFIAGEKYSEDYSDICGYALSLVERGIKNIVVTGYKEGDFISNIVVGKNGCKKIPFPKTGGYFSGTGDITAAVITGGVLRGMSLCDSAYLAGKFVSAAAQATESDNPNDGIAFEKFLNLLL